MNISTDKKCCENFAKNYSVGAFFQSMEFGEFQEKIPYRGKTWLLKYEGRNLCLVIRQKMRFGKCFLWIPYISGQCQVISDQWKDKIYVIFEDIRRIAKEEGAIFARVEPGANWDEKNTEELKKYWRILPAKKRFTPEHTLVLDLDKNEDELLAQMKPKGRYNINVARKNGVVVKKFGAGVPSTDFDAFYEILKKTGNRDEFGIHPKSFYKTLLETLAPKNMATLFLAYAPVSGAQKTVGGIIVIFYNDTATYYYGASDYKHRNLMAPYLLQWEAICEARRRNIRHYDFLGIAPSDDKKHPWAGVTAFKKKFGGREAAYPKAFDIVYKPVWYLLV